jgi:hypothetical protein
MPCARRAFQAIACFAAKADQVASIGVVDRQPLGRAQVRFSRRGWRREAAVFRILYYSVQTFNECSL